MTETIRKGPQQHMRTSQASSESWTVNGNRNIKYRIIKQN